MGKILGKVVGLVLLAALVVFGGGGWYYAGQALDPVTPGPEPRHVQVVAIDDVSVTLRDVDAPSWALGDLRNVVTVGFDHDRGYLRLSGRPLAVETSPIEATRMFEVVEGNPPAVGDRGSLEIAAFPDDPNEMGLGVQDVQAESDLGSFPGWVFRGDQRGDQWVVFVHGRGGTRAEALRAVDHVVGELGMSALVITHRNDPGAPASRDGHGHLGDSEWRDLQTWLRWLRDQHGPSGVVLYGYSQGGSVVASCLRRCEDTSDVSRVVLDSPMLSVSETLRLQARGRDIPRPLIDPLLASAEVFIGLRGGPELDRLEHVRALAEMDLPILVFHGTEDSSVPAGPSRALATRDPDQVTFVDYDGDHTRLWNVDESRHDQALADFLTTEG